MSIDTVLTGGTVVTADSSFQADVAIDGEKICAVGNPETMPEADEVIDATDRLVMPGMLDAQTHVDDRSSLDTHREAGGAAAVGGITTYMDFSWMYVDHRRDKPPQSLMEGIDRKQRKAEESGAIVDWALHGGITREDLDVLSELEEAVESGVPSFKIFTTSLSHGLTDRVLERVAELGGVCVFHTEDGSVCEYRTRQLKEEGTGEPGEYPNSKPDYAEAMAVDAVLRMAAEHGAKYFGIHTTSRAAADVIDRYRDDGSLVRAETCTHYTVYDDSAFEEYGNLVKIAPPLRKPDDVEAMFEYLGKGTLDLVSTDHCSFKRREKEDVDNWWESPSGANQLQTSFPVYYDEAVNRRGYDPSFVVRTMSTNIAETYGMPNKGTLDPGTDADIVVFDPTETYTIDPADNVSESDFSIYEGREITGQVEQTFVRGELVAADGQVVGDPEHGQFIERDVPDWSP
jgi:dihydropyrimidinase